MGFIISLIGSFAQAGKRLIPYMLYSLSSFFSYLLVVSIFAFFSFILGHKFNMIEVWVQKNILVILIFAKLFSFFIIYRYYQVQDLGCSLVRRYFTRPFSYPDRDFYVMLSFLIIFCVFELNPTFNQQWSVVTMAINLIGYLVYFITDFLVVSYLLKTQSPRSEGDAVLTVVLAALIFGLLSYAIAPAKNNFASYFIFEFFLMIFFYYRQKSWIASAWVLLFFNMLINIMFSLDIFYGENIGFFRCEQGLQGQQILVVLGVYFCYLKRHVLLPPWGGKDLTGG